MPLLHLDHVNILCQDLAASQHFYGQVLGMEEGSRPPFDFPGAWFYLGGRPVVHLVGDSPLAGSGTKGSIDHVAFDATDLPGMRQRLHGRGIKYVEKPVPGRPVTQIFLHDPDGIMIEINFRNQPVA